MKEKIISIIVVVIVFAGIAYFGLSKSGKISSLSKVAKPADNVALVNGAPITRADFNSQFAIATTTLAGQGVDVTNPDKIAEIKTQVLDNLINNELVSQAIAKTGIKTTDAEVEVEYQNVLKEAGSKEQLKVQMDKINLSETQLRINITKQLTVQKYLLQNIDISTATTTSAEIKKLYDESIKGVAKPPKLKDVTEQVRQQIINNKQQVLINTFISALRTKATISTSTNPL